VYAQTSFTWLAVPVAELVAVFVIERVLVAVTVAVTEAVVVCARYTKSHRSSQDDLIVNALVLWSLCL
jgi:hypothetical protein